MQIVLSIDDKEALDEIVLLIKTLSPQEQYELKCFLNGFSFAKSIESTKDI